MNNQSTEQFGPPGGRRFSLRALAPTLLPNVVLPWAIYQVLTGQGVATVPALMATAVVPLANIGYGFARHHRLDALGIMTLAFVLVGLVTSLLSGDPTFYLIKESLLTGVWGLILLGSLVVAPRPLIFYFGRQFASGSDPTRAATFDSLWQSSADFRRLQRWLCVLWGLGLVAEALARVVLVFMLPISTFLIVSPIMAYSVIGILMLVTILRARRLGREIRAMRQQRAAAAAQHAEPAEQVPTRT